ncbi:AFR713Wp [Eremothecium gossypii ATCC 10895]|uniref:AFR713Wp n=1 Tax=Eremothecium gossypii (strain ATCC 10895 / CBS 109.51 / FGSC 9923 / NRRL Y-1056) TaxID=284811 RepID=Q751W2_EREGS|nr:AFR713Wp [Eremothecium gossypii ATCC 10895]AAS54085.1 AFR713Wp [Eremothecium gossypii ATCC 10895]AEY98400.1 FAFR713Wp [Eremothecium gossypii FDAG1]
MTTTVEAGAIQDPVAGNVADENRQPSGAGGSAGSCPKETKKEIVKLQPAPIPQNSPWKPVQMGTGAGRATEDGRWPSAHEVATKLADDGSGRGRSQPMVTTGKEKWVPMKPAMLVPGQGLRKMQRKKKNGQAVNGGAAKRKTGNKAPPSQQKRAPDSHRKAHDEASAASATPSAPEEHVEQRELGEQQQVPEAAEQGAEHPTQHMAQMQPQPRRRFYGGRQQHSADGHKQFVSRQYTGSGGQPRRNFHNRPHSSAYRPRVYSSQIDPMMAIDNIARQIEYYFSIENLKTDSYLQSLLNKEGWVSFSTIASFYRLIKLSWGGDNNLIMGALREIVSNDNATVDVARVVDPVLPETPVEAARFFGSYAVRAKAWEQWVLDKPKDWSPTLEILTGSALDEFRFIPLPVPIQPVAPAVDSAQLASAHSSATTDDCARVTESA